MLISNHYSRQLSLVQSVLSHIGWAGLLSAVLVLQQRPTCLLWLLLFLANVFSSIFGKCLRIAMFKKKKPATVRPACGSNWIYCSSHLLPSLFFFPPVCLSVFFSGWATFSGGETSVTFPRSIKRDGRLISWVHIFMLMKAWWCFRKCDIYQRWLPAGVLSFSHLIHCFCSTPNTVNVARQSELTTISMHPWLTRAMISQV